MDVENESVGTFMSKESSFGNALASSIFSAPEPINVFSVFGDSDCGEPLEAQHLRLDFTPTKDDDEYSQRKCCDFWKYIAGRSDLKHLMVLPEKEKSNQSTESQSTTSSIKPSPKKFVSRPQTAVSMLQMVEEKGLINRAFEAKMQQSRCTVDSHDYDLSAKARKPRCICPGPTPCPGCINAPVSKTQVLCEKLGAWDINHPKGPCDDPNSAESPDSCSYNCNRICLNYQNINTVVCDIPAR